MNRAADEAARLEDFLRAKLPGARRRGVEGVQADPARCVFYGPEPPAVPAAEADRAVEVVEHCLYENALAHDDLERKRYDPALPAEARQHYMEQLSRDELALLAVPMVGRPCFIEHWDNADDYDPVRGAGDFRQSWGYVAATRFDTATHSLYMYSALHQNVEGLASAYRLRDPGGPKGASIQHLRDSLNHQAAVLENSYCAQGARPGTYLLGWRFLWPERCYRNPGPTNSSRVLLPHQVADLSALPYFRPRAGGGRGGAGARAASPSLPPAWAATLARASLRPLLSLPVAYPAPRNPGAVWRGIPRAAFLRLWQQTTHLRLGRASHVRAMYSQPAAHHVQAPTLLGVRASAAEVAAPSAAAPPAADGHTGAEAPPEHPSAAAPTPAPTTTTAEGAAPPAPAADEAALRPAATTTPAAGVVVGEIVQKASRSIQKIADPAVQREVCATMQELVDTLYEENQHLQAQNEHFRASKSQGLKEALLRYLGVFNSAAQQRHMSEDLDRLLGDGSRGQVSDELADLLRACCDRDYLTAATAAAASGRRLAPGNWESDYRLVIRSAAEDAVPAAPQPLKAQLQTVQEHAAAVLRLPTAAGTRAAAGTPLARPDVLARKAAPAPPTPVARPSAPVPEVYQASEPLDKYFADEPTEAAPHKQWLSLGRLERPSKARRLN
eukprot:g77640.t1